ncbi:MAG: purine-nucleoside phosphorylase [Bacteroidales bacterium]|nr:purine-nucleoside phosphorylase [Bacteroidales bacterium]
MNREVYTRLVDEAATFVANRIADAPTPEVAIILGSGLGGLVDHIDKQTVIPYSTIPGFKQSTAVGHKGNLIAGTLGSRRVLAMQGRFHYYEGYTMQEVTLPVRVMSRIGITTLFVSNAAGAVNPEYRIGDMMVIDDHINFMPNPLIGPNLDSFGTRFPDMTEAYSPRLRQIANREAVGMGLSLRHGVYVAVTGPTYETPAEYRMYRAVGGDAVGMSTVPEVIVARHCGIEVFGLSVITNQANDLGTDCHNDGNDVVQAANAAADRMTTLVSNMINNCK